MKISEIVISAIVVILGFALILVAGPGEFDDSCIPSCAEATDK